MMNTSLLLSYILSEALGNNLLVKTQQFDNAAWNAGANGTTVTANNEVAPDGTLTGDTVAFASGAAYLLQSILSFSATSGSQVTYSCYAKTQSRIITFGGASTAGVDVFSTRTGNNGWYRQILTRTFSSTAVAALQCLIYATNVGASSQPLSWAQLVRGGRAMRYREVA